MQAGRLAEAEEIYRQLLETHPEHHEALFKMGVLQAHQGHVHDAIDYFRKVLTLTPDMVEAQNNLGNVYFQKKDYAQALVCYEQVLSSRPRNVESLNNLGNVYKMQGQFDLALASYKKALTQKPGSASIFNNIGTTYRGMGRLDDALAYFRKALAVKPEFAHVQWNMSALMLESGDYATGLPLYDKRFDPEVLLELGAPGLGEMNRKFSSKPRWKGENLQGKTLAIWSEQGLGDSVMMLRYLPLLKKKGVASVIVYCPASLKKIMLTGATLVVDHGATLPLDSFDLHCPMMSLPYAFGTTLETIPNATPYLSVPAALSDKWAAQLAKFKGLKVGLAWAGNKDFPKDAQRSIALDQFASLAAIPGVQLVSLQKGESAEQLKSTGWRVLDWMDVCDDLLDTAALVANLDLVITVDTAIAHVAGALGKPVWLLNRANGDWRWMLEREDSPWYPSMRIFRQQALYQWDEVLASVAAELGKLAPAGQPGALGLSATEWEKAVAAANQGLAIGKKKGLFAKLFG
jgi:Flp pilus assembly protein TadD